MKPSTFLALAPFIFSCTGDEVVVPTPETAPAAAPAPDENPPAAVASGPGDASDLPVPDAPAGGRPDIVLVVYDTARADHLGIYGHDRPTSPRLDALARDGMVFSRAYAQSGWTLASFASLLSGQYPHQHRVIRDLKVQSRFGCLTPEQVTLAEAMKRAGYRTAAFVNNTFLAPEFGIQQGFDRYDYKGATNVQFRSAQDTVQTALAWMDEGPAEAPVFALVHFMEPHLDYAPPAAVRGRFADPKAVPDQLIPREGQNPFTLMQVGALKADPATQAYSQALYDEELLAVDQALGALSDGLHQRGRMDRSYLVVTADHGEEFWEHGGFEHGHALWSELTRVPLIVHLPKSDPGPRGQRVDTVVEHVDLVRGLLTRAGAPIPATVQGEDIFTVAATGGDRASMQENCLYGPACLSLITQQHRLTFDPQKGAGGVWLVDPDGHERTRLQGEAQTQAATPLVDLLTQRRGNLAPIDAAAGPKVPSYGTFSQLAALGYVDAADVEAAENGEGWQGCNGG